MSVNTGCPNCVKKRLNVPLRMEGDSKICPLCESILRMKSRIDTFGSYDFFNSHPSQKIISN